MGKVNRKKSKMTKADKSNKLNEKTYVKKEQTSKGLIDEALELFRSGEVSEAKKLAKRVIKTCDDASILAESGAILSEVGEESLAREALRRSVTLDPEHSYEKYITLGQLTSGNESLKYICKGIELLKVEEKEEKRKLSRAYCNIAELYMTDLCMEKDAQKSCHEAVNLAVTADDTNPEAFQTAASFLISSSKPDEAKIELKRGLSLWMDQNLNSENDEDHALASLKAEKVDAEIRMNALRLTVELALWDEAITIARDLSEENYENCEPRYFLAYSLFRFLETKTDGEEKKNLRLDCHEAAMDAQRLADKTWREKRDRTAKDVLEQVNDLLEDLGPVEFQPPLVEDCESGDDME